MKTLYYYKISQTHDEYFLIDNRSFKIIEETDKMIRFEITYTNGETEVDCINKSLIDDLLEGTNFVSLWFTDKSIPEVCIRKVKEAFASKLDAKIKLLQDLIGDLENPKYPH